MTKLQRLWKDKWIVLKALYNAIRKKKNIEIMSIERKKICRSNKCGFYDPQGTGENTFIKGKPACGICGCNINILTHSPESTCSLQERGQAPLWKDKQV